GERQARGGPAREGVAAALARASRVSVAAQAARDEGPRRGRRDLAAGGHRQRHRGRARAVRRPHHGDTGEPRPPARVAPRDGMKPAPFDYVDPRTVDEALDHLSRHGDEAKVLAGGQSLAPMLNFRLARPAVLVDINRVAGLDGVTESSGALRVGALVRQRHLERTLDARFPLLTAGLG